MADTKFITLASLPLWLDELANDATVYAPKKEGSAVVYRQHEKDAMPELESRPTESAKHIIFPRSEELFRFSYTADPEVVGKKNVQLKEATTPGEAIVFGTLSCDARGFFAFDPVYNGCGTKGLAKDTYYLRRRAKTSFIVLVCHGPLSTCFCNWTGGSPASKDGADVLATRVNDAILLEPVTKRGAELLGSSLLQPASQEQVEAAQRSQEAATHAMPTPPNGVIESDQIAKAVLGHFDDAEFWMAQADGCLSCGACTYLCPTCYCFTITDESTGVQGARLRSWDNCMSSLFTLEASGHNPRMGKAMRLKNRVGHKFSYYPTLHGGRYSCCGCGRCIKSCPSSVDIRRVVENAITTATMKE